MKVRIFEKLGGHVQIQLRLDVGTQHIGDKPVQKRAGAGDRIVFDRKIYQVLDVCYEGNQGYAQVWPVKRQLAT